MIKLVFIPVLLSLSLSCRSQVQNQPPSQQEQRPEDILRFSVISDLNGSYGNTTYSEDLKKSILYLTDKNSQNLTIDLVLSTGDMVAGQKEGLDYQKMWKSFHRNISLPLNLAGIPLAPSPGNHDASLSPVFAKERVYYQKTFSLPSPDVTLGKLHFLAGSQYPFYYAFVLKNALFISLDATLASPLSNEQLNWLQTTLETTQAGLKVIFGHVPLYPYAFGRAHEYIGSGDQGFAKKFEKLLEDNKVDLFLTGHHHVYYSGHRKGHVEYVSVPLLGDGPRRLLSENSEVSPKGFLVFEWSHHTGLKMKAISSNDFNQIKTENLPEKIQVPGISSELCLYCSDFPLEYFIPGSDRALYLRSDTFKP